MNNIKRYIIPIIIITALSLMGCTQEKIIENSDVLKADQEQVTFNSEAIEGFNGNTDISPVYLSDIPKFSGEPYIAVFCKNFL